jgi:hypothetical protein
VDEEFENLLSREDNHISSQQIEADARYSALAEDLDTSCCFLDFQDTRVTNENTKTSNRSASV